MQHPTPAFEPAFFILRAAQNLPEKHSATRDAGWAYFRNKS
jgi:hypothetical protein